MPKYTADEQLALIRGVRRPGTYLGCITSPAVVVTVNTVVLFVVQMCTSWAEGHILPPSAGLIS
jgi:hypothetical protein